MTQTTTAPSPWALAGTKTPDLNMVATLYGVRVDDIGEDGDVIGLGHVGKYRMLAALLRHAREDWGDDLFWGRCRTLDYALDSIDYRWMVNMGTDAEWNLYPAQPTDPGAFPVTWWTA